MNDRLSASWVLLVGSLLVGYFYWRTREAKPSAPTGKVAPSPATRRGQTIPRSRGGTPPILPPVSKDDISFPWPPEVPRGFIPGRNITERDRRMYGGRR